MKTRSNTAVKTIPVSSAAPLPVIPNPFGQMAPTIRRFLNLTDMEYNEMLFDSAVDFAAFYFGEGEDSALVMQCPAYWLWYRNQFMQCDLLFMHRFGDAKPEASVKVLRQHWREAHAADKVESYPGKEVVHEAMCKVYDTYVNATPQKGGKPC